MIGVLQNTVGHNFRRVREEMGLSQEGLGDHLGVHRTYIGGVERGERNLSLRTLERLSTQLGVHPFDLLWDESVGVVVGEDGRPRFDARDTSGA